MPSKSRGMKRNFHIFPILCIFAAVFPLSSCKGRTAENMTPSGETIEVVINQQDVAEEPADSVILIDAAQNN